MRAPWTAGPNEIKCLCLSFSGNKLIQKEAHEKSTAMFVRQKTGNKAEFDKACLVMSGAVRVVVLGSRGVYWMQGYVTADHWQRREETREIIMAETLLQQTERKTGWLRD